MPKLAIIDQVVSAGGGERFLQGLVEALGELPAIRDWEVHIVVSRRNSGGGMVSWPDRLKASNIKVTYMFDDRLSRSFYHLSRAGRFYGIPGTARLQHLIPRIVGQFGPTSLRKHADPKSWIEDYCSRHQFDAAYFSFPYLMECPRLTTPIFATPHDFNHKRFPSFGSARARIDREMPDWLKMSRRLIVSSDFVANELRHFYPEYSGKVSVVRSGIPGEGQIPSDEEVNRYRERMKLPSRFLLTPGWIVAHKNQRIVFEALKRLRSHGQEIPLVCVGPNSAELQPGFEGTRGPYVIELLQLADRLGLRYGRDFQGLGYVRDVDLECLYRSASALVMPTLYEAGSFPMREAIRARCPAICSRIAPIVEEVNLIRGNAWLFDPADADELASVISHVVSDEPAVREKIRSAAEMARQVYSWQNMAAGYLSIFQDLAK